MAERKDYYAILGVSPSASAAEINEAYRRRVFGLHPDGWEAYIAKHPELSKNDIEAIRAGSTEALKDLNEAREVLSDPIKRRDYDLSDPAKREEALKEAVDIAFSEDESRYERLEELIATFGLTDDELDAALAQRVEEEKVKKSAPTQGQPAQQQPPPNNFSGAGPATSSGTTTAKPQWLESIGDDTIIAYSRKVPDDSTAKALFECMLLIDGKRVINILPDDVIKLYSTSYCDQVMEKCFERMLVLRPEKVFKAVCPSLIKELAKYPSAFTPGYVFNKMLSSGGIDGAWLAAFAAENEKMNGAPPRRSDYDKCRKLIERAIKENPELSAVRGAGCYGSKAKKNQCGYGS